MPRTAPRSYTMQARKDAVEETRLAITEATMRLHERVGPRATTVSAVAEEANVTRLTVYRHFPSDEALVIACSAHWRELHPRPDPATWAQVRDPVVRLRMALTETFIIAEPVDHFAYPFGHSRACGKREAEISRSLGFRTAVTTRPGMVFAEHRNELHALPRVCLEWHENASTLQCKLNGFNRAVHSRLGDPIARM